jgi:hypothetical protein
LPRSIGSLADSRSRRRSRYIGIRCEVLRGRETADVLGRQRRVRYQREPRGGTRPSRRPPSRAEHAPASVSVQTDAPLGCAHDPPVRRERAARLQAGRIRR